MGLPVSMKMVDEFNLPMSEADAQKKISEISGNLRKIAEILETDFADYLHQPYENIKDKTLADPGIIIENSKRLFWAQEALEQNRKLVVAGYMRLFQGVTKAYKS